ncbi:hypothetical protein [Pseudomonas sp. M47T1]|uniref:hypothetical protein n=1 Tax=Pseudomonas sp. M47T1 TaxID=1179778 RepID=UPI0012FBD53A|nr:hypothetical protein [Pseudomonas sp. M47T1]
MSMRILLICKDMGGYIRKLSDFLKLQGHEVLLLDTSASSPKLDFLSGKLRSVARHRLGLWLDARKIKAFGRADYLLVVNPGQVEPATIERAMAVSTVKKAYLYDSLARSPVSEAWLKRYDQVYSFESPDAERHGLTKLHNFMYEEVVTPPAAGEAKYKAFLVMAGLDRLALLDAIGQQLEQAGFPEYLFMVQYKKAGEARSRISFFRERLGLDDVTRLIADADILIDLIRPRQSGLSFRLFEGMMHGKKVITNNASVREYDFYNPANILVIDEQNPQVPRAFLEGQYVPVADAIMQRYSLAGWCNTVFSAPR